MTSPAKILVVEDDAPIRELYRLKLELAGLEVMTATNGEEGLMVAKNFMPDVILLDLMMPHMDGTEMLRRLRSKDWGKNILVIVLTNISKTEAPMDLRLLNVDQYIVKAYYTPKQVLETVIDTLRRHE